MQTVGNTRNVIPNRTLAYAAATKQPVDATPVKALLRNVSIASACADSWPSCDATIHSARGMPVGADAAIAATVGFSANATTISTKHDTMSEPTDPAEALLKERPNIAGNSNVIMVTQTPKLILTVFI